MTVQSCIIWMKPLEFLRLPTLLDIQNKTKLCPRPGIIQNYLPPMIPYVHDATVAGTYRFYVPAMIEDGLTVIK